MMDRALKIFPQTLETRNHKLNVRDCTNNIICNIPDTRVIVLHLHVSYMLYFAGILLKLIILKNR